LFMAPSLAREDFQPSISKGGRSVPTFEDVVEIGAKSPTLFRKNFFGANFQASCGESNAGILSTKYPAKPSI